ncbi:hypothetical protein EC835_1196 [Providencia alcalifaciens]|uniref:Fimbrial protein n=2 Tax=Providencia TaxID=586 RepID=A0A4R3NIS2_9GAMM|nr:hypothetical protein [Providencia alcalifaciens]TCT28167.1 hypothetical protein EC835_1196 [Providencia alcalifaciens]
MEKTMMMKKRIGLLVGSALLMGSSVSALANTAEFRTQIRVLSADACVLSVAAQGDTAWALNWEEQDRTAGTSTLTVKEGELGEPLLVRVKLTDASGASCSLNGIKLGATAATTATATGLFKAAVGEGFWEYMPTLTKLETFSTVAGAEAGTAAAKLPANTVKAKYAAGEHVISETAQHNANTEVTVEGTTQRFLALTHNYVNATGITPFNLGGQAQAVTLESTAAEPVKSALIGVGALVAKNPVNAEGQADFALLDTVENVNLPFTVTVELP